MRAGFVDFGSLLAEPLSFGLSEYEKEYRMHVAQPKELRKRDLHVEVENNILTISGERELEERGRKRRVTYHRSITLPEHVDADHIEADYNPDGTLHITIPKSATAIKKKVLIRGTDSNQQTEQQQQGGGGGGGGGGGSEPMKEEKSGEQQQQQQQCGGTETGSS